MLHRLALKLDREMPGIEPAFLTSRNLSTAVNEHSVDHARATAG
jgi:hypothetical protein